jgi:hypothetical protein
MQNMLSKLEENKLNTLLLYWEDKEAGCRIILKKS